MRKGKRFLINAFLLSFSSFAMRSIGVSFNVYLSKRLGAHGVGLFQLILSVEMFAVTLATSGIALATTRLIAERAENKKAVMKRCMCYALCFGILSAVLLFFFAKPIGTGMLRDARTVSSLKLISFSLPFIALSSVLGGYFTAVRRVIKSAAAQLLEQLVKIGLCAVGLQYFLSKGTEFACMAVVGGGCAAEILSFFFLFALYLTDRDAEMRQCKRKSKPCAITGQMLHIALPVAFSAYVRSAFTTLEHILIPPRLRMFGYEQEEALARYGMVHGMVLPVLLFPSAVLSAFSGLLVPEMAEYHVHGSRKQIHYVMTRVLHAALIFAIGVGGIFFAYSYELGMAIYQSAEAGMYLKLFAPLVIVMYLDGVVDGMLKGLNQQLSSMRYNVLDSFLSVILVFFLIPHFGIGGYVAVIYISECFNGFFSLNRLICVTEFQVDYGKYLIKPCVAILTSAFAVRFMAKAFGMFVGTALPCLVGCICVTVLLYLALLWLASCISREDVWQVLVLFRGNEK